MAKGNELFSEKTLKEFGRDYVKLLTIFLKKAKKSASGALINSIDYRIKDEANAISIEIEANDYLKFVDKGRKPGTYPPIREIAQWCKLKGIDESAKWLIARSIFKFGIAPTNVIAQTEREILTSPTLQKKYEESLAEVIETKLINQFKQ